MRLLLDTHTFIWSTSDPSKLSTHAQTLLVDLEHTWYLSIVSVWEIQIKLQVGKLKLDLPLPELIEQQQQVNNLQLLSIDLQHIYTLNQLANHHRDPFDRLLIAQSIAEQLVLVSKDTVFDRYNIQRVW